MPSEVKQDVGILKNAFKDFMDDECPRMAAALSYYTVFALPPLLVLILLIVGAFVSGDTIQQQLQSQIGSAIGPEAAKEIGTIIENANRPDVSKPLASIISIVGLIIGATGAFGQLQAALNRAWEVEPDPEKGGLMSFIFKRVLSLGMILGIAFLLLVSLVLSTMLSALGGALGSMGGLSQPVMYVLNLVISFAVITLLFAAIFKTLPDAEIAWNDVWVGAAVTALLFVIGKFLIGLYMGQSNPGEAFGAAGALAVLLVWIYYSSMILLFGAEFTQKWADKRGSGIKPEKGAVRVVEEKRHVREPQEQS